MSNTFIQPADTLSLPRGYTSRPATMDDVPATVELINAIYQAMIGEDDTNPEALAHSWQEPHFEIERGTRLLIAPDDRLAAYADFWDTTAPYVRYGSWLGLHPDFADPVLCAAMIEWIIASGRESVAKAPPDARVVLHLETMPQAVTVRETAQRLGFRHIRSFFEMRIEMDAPPPTPTLPHGITLRSLVRGQDETAIVRALREGFADHWGHVEKPFEQDYERWMHFIDTYEGFDPSLWMMAMDGDQIAGLCLCNPYTDYDPALAWVDKLTVLRPYRKQGLGLALLHHAFGVFWQRGTMRVGLGVDASSLTGALHLYENAGMSATFEFMAYELELRTGKDYMKQLADE